MDSDIENYVSWQGGELEVGDKIVIEVIDSNFDAPTYKGVTYSEEELRERKLIYFYDTPCLLYNFLLN